MKVIWVLENIEKQKQFYSRLGILTMLASVNLWRKNHPEDFTILYADDITIDLFDKLKILEFWHGIKSIPNHRKINKTIFWASSKLQVLANIQDPVILLDNDTHVYKPLKPFLDLEAHYVSNYEIGKGFYPTLTDRYVKELSYKTRWETNSVNVSFLNLPDPEFTRMYANMSLQLMEELTHLKAPNSQYLIFAEQLLFYHLLNRENKTHKSIISTYWDCAEWTWGENHNKGIWTINNSGLFFKHYGPSKRHILDNTNGENYDREIAHLRNCINYPALDLSLVSKR